MTNFIETKKAKFIAVFISFNILLEIATPSLAMALGGGPSQPEVDSFEPVGTTQMVDLFSGDFNYNIPLFDLGGYPINIAYHGGIGMEQEASWVGLGWNINPGAITRNMRGVPDDFDGDEIHKKYKVADNITIGGKVSVKSEIFGKNFIKKVKVSKNNFWSSKIPTTLNLGIYHNTYKGYGISFDLGVTAASKERKGKPTIKGNFSLGFDSQNGADFTASGSLSKDDKDASINFSHNSIDGLKQIGAGFTPNYIKTKKKDDSKIKNGGFGANIPISNSTYVPFANANTVNYNYSVKLNIGKQLVSKFEALGALDFYYSKNKTFLDEKIKSYGYTNQSNAKQHSLTDFNREKESAYTVNHPNLPLSFATYDLFSVAGQGTGGTYRPHRNNLGNNIDPEYKTTTGNGVGVNLGLDLGVFSKFKIGGDLGVTYNYSINKQWLKEDKNNTTETFGYVKDANNKLFEEVYFKGGGEMTPNDEAFCQSYGGEKPASLELVRNNSFALKAGNFVKLNNTIVTENENITPKAHSETARQIRSNVMTYLTAKEASTWGIGLDTEIKSYPLNTSWNEPNTNSGYRSASHFSSESRISEVRKAHHYSEIKHFSPDGTQYVYGIPAYNKVQSERSFSVGTPSATDLKEGLISFSSEDNSPENNQGVQKLFNSTEIPPFAHSYLLTGVLSSDYVDLTGDGITDDDLGTAVKFNYTKYSSNYKWRTPFTKARLQEGLKSDQTDQVGSYVYGEKELWYIHSIVSKTHIAEFKMSPRNDGIGTIGPEGGKDLNGLNNNNCLLKLDSIVIYSKFDRVKNGEKAVPVKTIVFVYDYSLCKGIPNSVHASDNTKYTESGKLTLKEIYFTYGKSGKGRLSPYKFSYSSTNPDYDITKADRWGNYAESDAGTSLIDFPYVPQNESKVNILDQNASAWCLSSIQLPSGGLINIEYECDDYAYVQNKKAMQMFKIIACTDKKDWNPLHIKNTLYDGNSDNIYLFFKLNKPIPSKDSSLFRKEYLTDENDKMIEQLFFDFSTNMDNENNTGSKFERVRGYVNIDKSEYGVHESDQSIGFIKVEKVAQGDIGLNKVSPIVKTIWQDALLDKRHLVYKGTNTNVDNGNALEGLLSAMSQVLNIITGPYENLKWKKVGKYFKINDSWVRLYNPNKMKKGGGSRVKQILINDNWASMKSNQASTQYGQKFEYKLLDNNNNVTEYSSGVASYEPMFGGEENPFRAPINYKQRVFMGPNKNLYQEAPFGESVFPGASVGYSSVIVTNIAKNKTQGTATGFTLNEFYTSKDYPVILDETDKKHYDNSGGRVGNTLKSIFSYFKGDYVGVSQGYVIILNDMHGKAKSVKVFGEMNNGTDLISGTEYKYKEQSRGRLSNKSKLLTQTGEIVEKSIGLEMDISVDNRNSKSVNINGGISLDVDAFFPLVFLAIPSFGINYSQTNTGFYSSVLTKVIQQYGILEETIAYDYGSQVSTKNLLWDEQTGNVLLTSVTNEFDDPLYNFTYPAHLAYDRMGPAYKNIGYSAELDLNQSGKATLVNNHFVMGDELYMIDQSNNNNIRKGWVLKTYSNIVQVIDREGNGINGKYHVKVIRSGRRNLSATPIGSVATIQNPMPDNSTSLLLNQQIIQSSATTFSDVWPGYCDYMSYYKIANVCDTINLRNLIYPFIRKSIEDYGLLTFGHNLARDTIETPHYQTNECSFSSGSLFDFSKLNYLDWSLYDSADALKTFVYRKLIKSNIDTSVLSFDSTFLIFDNNSKDYKFLLRETTGYNYVTLRLPLCFHFWDCIEDSCLIKFNNIDSISKKIYPPDGNSYDMLEYVYMYKNGDSTILILSNTFNNCGCEYTECVTEYYCDYEIGDVVNPFVNGMLGTWRPKSSFAIVADRNYLNDGEKTHNRKDGLIKDYIPYWEFNNNKLRENPNRLNKWVETNTITSVSPEGNELEEKNALGIYSAQLYGYTNTLVTAVAANARHRQIANDNFEDYSFPYIGCRNDGHWDFRKNMLNITYTANISGNNYLPYTHSYIVEYPKTINDESNPIYIADSISHTGLHSLAITAENSHTVNRLIDYSTININSASDTSLYRIDNVNKCVSAFAPDTGFYYVVSGWVKEDVLTNTVNSYANAKIKVELLNGTSVVQSFSFDPNGSIIEGWQRVYNKFRIPAGITNIAVTLQNNGEPTAYFDDIRIHPFNSSMISYVYHPVHLKIMAELDDNNYATFYEYDEEGSLIRIKKETERGILTIQESRKSVKK